MKLTFSVLLLLLTTTAMSETASDTIEQMVAGDRVRAIVVAGGEGGCAVASLKARAFAMRQEVMRRVAVGDIPGRSGADGGHRAADNGRAGGCRAADCGTCCGAAATECDAPCDLRAARRW